MVVVDIDHPDIEAYINWKVHEEEKVAALVTGSKTVARHLKAIMKACVNCQGSDGDCFDPNKNPALKREVRAAKKAQVPENYIKRVIQFARQGYHDIEFKTYDTDWIPKPISPSRPELQQLRLAARRIPARGGSRRRLNLIRRIDGKVHKTLKARDLWDQIGYAAWASADPGLHFNTTMNDCTRARPAVASNASNPCSSTCSWMTRPATSPR